MGEVRLWERNTLAVIALFMRIADLWQKRHHLWVDNKYKTLTTLNHLIRKQGENEGLQIVFDIKDV